MFKEDKGTQVPTESLCVLARIFLLSCHSDKSLSLSRDRVHRLTAAQGQPLESEMELVHDARDIAEEIISSSNQGVCSDGEMLDC
jgi:hypothetical protein